MASLFCRSAAAVALWASFGAIAHAEPLPSQKVRVAMAGVEALLVRQGINVAGYADSAPPPVELVPSSDPSLQGNDGGYVDGRIYLNGDGMAECADLTLLHELVHDVTVKHRLFTNVSNADVRTAFEALADSVTAAAADEPYRPGCLPHRRFEVDTASLAAMAAPADGTSSLAVAWKLMVPVFFKPGSARLSSQARALIADVASKAMAGSYATIIVADAAIMTPNSARTLDDRRAKAVQRVLKRSVAQRSVAQRLKAEITQGEARVTVIALAPMPAESQRFTAGPGIGRGLMAP